MRLKTPRLTLGQLALAGGIAFYSLAMPGDLGYKLDAMGFGVCHQIHSHSFIIGGHQLPLCARCTGMYLGVLAGLGLLMALRRRASRFPSGYVGAILILFFAVMALDGANSSLQTFDAGIWDTTNLVRIVTGGLSGLSIASLFYPAFNLSLWHPDALREDRALERPVDLVGCMVAVGLLIALALAGSEWLFYPVSILSIGGMLALLTMANTVLVLLVMRRDGGIRELSAALTPLLVGLLLSLIELTLLAWGRASLAPMLANNVGMPVVPGLP